MKRLIPAAALAAILALIFTLAALAAPTLTVVNSQVTIPRERAAQQDHHYGSIRPNQPDGRRFT
jgi:hypothetical protein